MDNNIPGCLIKPFKCCFAFSCHDIKVTLIICFHTNTFKASAACDNITNWNKLPCVLDFLCKLQIDDFLRRFFFHNFPFSPHQIRKYATSKAFESKDKKFLCDEKNVLLDREAPCCLVGELKYSFGVIYLIVFSCFWTNKTFFRYNKVGQNTERAEREKLCFQNLSASGPKLFFASINQVQKTLKANDFETVNNFQSFSKPKSD